MFQCRCIATSEMSVLTPDISEVVRSQSEVPDSRAHRTVRTERPNVPQGRIQGGDGSCRPPLDDLFSINYVYNKVERSPSIQSELKPNFGVAKGWLYVDFYRIFGLRPINGESVANVGIDTTDKQARTKAFAQAGGGTPVLEGARARGDRT